MMTRGSPSILMPGMLLRTSNALIVARVLPPRSPRFSQRSRVELQDSQRPAPIGAKNPQISERVLAHCNAHTPATPHACRKTVVMRFYCLRHRYLVGNSHKACNKSPARLPVERRTRGVCWLSRLPVQACSSAYSCGAQSVRQASRLASMEARFMLRPMKQSLVMRSPQTGSQSSSILGFSNRICERSSAGALATK